MLVMTRFVSFVSLNHPVVHKFHGPTPIAAWQSKALGLYYRKYRGDEHREHQVAFYSSRYSALKTNDLVSGLHSRRLPVASFAMKPQKEISGKSEGKKKDAEKKEMVGAGCIRSI
ncbi:hypothetical protein N7527_012116 [Penicillium freii]|nr:hypothetical protein N7527_012116 [Penicillium freii]